MCGYQVDPLHYMHANVSEKNYDMCPSFLLVGDLGYYKYAKRIVACASRSAAKVNTLKLQSRLARTPNIIPTACAAKIHLGQV